MGFFRRPIRRAFLNVKYIHQLKRCAFWNSIFSENKKGPDDQSLLNIPYYGAYFAFDDVRLVLATALLGFLASTGLASAFLVVSFTAGVAS